MVVRQDAYLTSRASAMQNVESTIHELGGIFQQLAHMVSPAPNQPASLFPLCIAIRNTFCGVCHDADA